MAPASPPPDGHTIVTDCDNPSTPGSRDHRISRGGCPVPHLGRPGHWSPVDTARFAACPGSPPDCPIPADRNPVLAYLASLTLGKGHRSMAAILAQFAAHLGYADPEATPSTNSGISMSPLSASTSPIAPHRRPPIRRSPGFEHCPLHLAPRSSPNGGLPADDRRPGGAQIPASGRALATSELAALFRVCADDTGGGALNVTSFGLMFSLARAAASGPSMPHRAPRRSSTLGSHFARCP